MNRERLLARCLGPLVAVMIAVSASDDEIRTVELLRIESSVNNLPVFAD